MPMLTCIHGIFELPNAYLIPVYMGLPNVQIGKISKHSIQAASHIYSRHHITLNTHLAAMEYCMRHRSSSRNITSWRGFRTNSTTRLHVSNGRQPFFKQKTGSFRHQPGLTQYMNFLDRNSTNNSFIVGLFSQSNMHSVHNIHSTGKVEVDHIGVSSYTGNTCHL